MKGRAIIQIPEDDIVDIAHNKTKGIIEIILEGDQYPGWCVGSDPMVILGASNLKDGEFIQRVVDDMIHGGQREEKKPTNQGNCGVCGLPVRHVYPWWTGKPDKSGSMPLHRDCAAIWFGWKDNTGPPILGAEKATGHATSSTWPHFIHFSDGADSDPRNVILTGKQKISISAECQPNTLVVGQEVHDILMLHPDLSVVHQVEALIENAAKRGKVNVIYPGINALIAEFFCVDQYIVDSGLNKNMWLCYAPKATGMPLPMPGYPKLLFSRTVG